MSVPRMDPESRAFFEAILPPDERVSIRPMFGQIAGFVNGNMFTGVFGASVFVRLPEAEREELLAIPGAGGFAPMPGRPMREYAVLPEQWRRHPEVAGDRIRRSLTWAAALPPRVQKK